MPPPESFSLLLAKRRKIGAGAGAVFKEHRLGGRQAHDIAHRIFDRLNKARRGLRIFIAALAGHGLVLLLVPVEIMFRAGDAIDIKEADVEPHRRIERAVLIHAQPRQVVVKIFRVGFGGEIAILAAAVGDCAAYAVHKLLDGILAMPGCRVAVEILAHDNLGRQCAPRGRNLDILLLEYRLAALGRDLG